MYDASEIGLNWRGSLESLSTVPQAKCAFTTPDGRLKEYTGRDRCDFILEETIADNTFGKLVWGKRRVNQQYEDVLVKKPSSQPHTKQEAVIQWLCNTSLRQYQLGCHCPQVFDIFNRGSSLWFSMSPIYNAPILDAYVISLPLWGIQREENGIAVLKIIAQIAMCCFVLERTIGFNHRDLKPDNILVKTDAVKEHTLKWLEGLEITVASSPTAILVDFGFSCLGPGKVPWIQAGDGVLPPLDPCPKVGRDIFMLLVFLLWRRDIRDSLTDQHLSFLKSTLHLTKERWSQMMSMRRDPIDWIYMLITERDFKCPALDPYIWLQTCATAYPEVVSIRTQPGSNIVSTS